MFTLVTDRSRFYKVKRGQTPREIENVYEIPVCGYVYSGKILAMEYKPYMRYSAKAGETLRSIAAKFGVEYELLEELNGKSPVYPTRKIFLPYKTVGNTGRRDI